MSDIVYELRERSLQAEQDGEPIALLDEAADEITRLRGDAVIAELRLEASHGEIEKLQHRVRFQDSVIRSGDVATLTDAEWAAIRDSIDDAENDAEQFGNEEASERATTLRGLLERLGGCVSPAIQPNDAMPMAGSGPTVPANGRASDCSEDERVRASASSIGNTQEVLIGGWRAGKPIPQPMLTDAERECLEWADEIAGNCEEFGRVEVLRGLLKRLGGER